MKDLGLKYGNHKIGDDTAIFNMGSATDCPSRRLGLCETVNKGIKCYAYKAEQQYPNAAPQARKRQERCWKKATAAELIKYLNKKIETRRKPTKYIRFNESGDFWSQKDVDKLSIVAEFMKLKDITTYGYTARSDLDFSNVKFLIKGSGWYKENQNLTGKTVVIKKNEPVPDNYIECPGSCKTCQICKQSTITNIAFRQH